MKFIVVLFVVILSPVFGLNSALAQNPKNMVVELTLPRFHVAEYHKPYVAIWLEDSDRNPTQLSLWYDSDMQDNEGVKWLKDLRQWWRRVGRTSQQPYDGITSATRGPGTHPIVFALNSSQLSDLSNNQYQLRIETTREVGGRELISIPINWPPKPNEFPILVTGSSEIESVTVLLQ